MFQIGQTYQWMAQAQEARREGCWPAQQHEGEDRAAARQWKVGRGLPEEVPHPHVGQGQEP